jgi:radical SAM superfamily enzyme YgiQ (UPF0313 family)
LLHEAGFETLRLGLETADFEMRSELDHKLTAVEFLQAVTHLKNAGFRGDQVGAYLLVGLPGQNMAVVERSINIVQKTGIVPVPAYYTPIPHTRLWQAAQAASRYNLGADPIFSNNAILPCLPEEFSWPALSRLKQMVH